MYQGGEPNLANQEYLRTKEELRNKEKLYKLQQELLESERKRISLLEALLKNNSIDF